MHLPPSFIILYMFTRSEVIVLTYKQTHTHTQTNKDTDKPTPLKTFIALRYATTLGNK